MHPRFWSPPVMLMNGSLYSRMTLTFGHMRHTSHQRCRILAIGISRNPFVESEQSAAEVIGSEYRAAITIEESNERSALYGCHAAAIL